jgi:hypothetical protein
LADRVHDLFLRELRPLHGSAPFVSDRRSCHRTLVMTCRVCRGDVSTLMHIAYLACQHMSPSGPVMLQWS